MSAETKQPKQPKAPYAPDAKLWKAARAIILRDGSQYLVGKVVYVDQYNVVIIPVESDALVLVPKHAIDQALLHRERFVKGGE